MVLKYNDFVLLTEGFQSSKLRKIIKEHGKTKYSLDNMFFYDLKDDEILDVMPLRDFREYKYSHRDAVYGIELEDNYVIVVSIEKLKYALYDERFREEFEKRRNERHKGNEYNRDRGKTGITHDREHEDSLIQDFRKKRDDINHKRCLEEFLKNFNVENIICALSDEYTDICENIFDYHDDDEYASDVNHEFEFEVDGVSFYGIINYNVRIDALGHDSYTWNSDVHVSFNDVLVSCFDNDDEEEYSLDELVEDKESVIDKYFKDYDETVESGIYDDYAYNGVSPYDRL